MMLVMIGIAVVVSLLVTALIYARPSRRSKRYRPGRPFPFTPVWFISARPDQPGAGRATREIAAAPREGRPGSTGGASDQW